MGRREGTGSIPCWVSARMLAVALPSVPLWWNVLERDTLACATCAGVWVGECMGRGDRSWPQAGLVASERFRHV
jgi:hypothetical protein